MIDDDSKVDCSQFSDDFDILRQLPFPITINPNSSADYEISTVHLNDDQTFVKSLTILNENIVPSSIYCLSNLDLLHIEGTPFENGSILYYETIKILFGIFI